MLAGAPPARRFFAEEAPLREVPACSVGLVEAPRADIRASENLCLTSSQIRVSNPDGPVKPEIHKPAGY
ncbi:MAG TPA: hypothetical protein VNY27_01445 [Solirubrobacteraceae bacterium]|nr:hypothetical protein [Solirubrobacteraceae bacterium]